MKDFKKGSFGGGKKFGSDRGGRGNFGGGNRFGGDRGGRSSDRGGFGGGDREMFTAVCSECGNKCEVPFRPTGEKPVFCNNCFGSKRGGTFERNDRGNRNDRPQKDFAKPTSSSDDRSIIELKKSVETLNSKLDSMIRMIQDLKPETKVPAKKESLGTIVKEATTKASAKKSVSKKETKSVAKKSAPKKAAKKKK